MVDSTKVIKKSKSDLKEATDVDTSFEEYLRSKGIATTLAVQRLKELCVERDLLRDSEDLFNTVRLSKDQQVLTILKDVFDVLKVPVTMLKMGAKYILQYDDFLIAVLPIDVSGFTSLDRCSVSLGVMKCINDYVIKKGLIFLTVVYLYDSVTGDLEVGILDNDMLESVSVNSVCCGKKADALPDVYKLEEFNRPVVNIRSETVWDTIRKTFNDTPITTELKIVLSSSKIRVKEEWVSKQLKEGVTEDGKNL